MYNYFTKNIKLYSLSLLDELNHTPIVNYSILRCYKYNYIWLQNPLLYNQQAFCTIYIPVGWTKIPEYFA